MWVCVPSTQHLPTPLTIERQLARLRAEAAAAATELGSLKEELAGKREELKAQAAVAQEAQKALAEVGVMVVCVRVGVDGQNALFVVWCLFHLCPDVEPEPPPDLRPHTPAPPPAAMTGHVGPRGGEGAAGTVGAEGSGGTAVSDVVCVYQRTTIQ